MGNRAHKYRPESCCWENRRENWGFVTGKQCKTQGTEGTTEATVAVRDEADP